MADHSTEIDELYLLPARLRTVARELRDEVLRDEAENVRMMRYPIFFMNELDDAQRAQFIAFMEATPLSPRGDVTVGPRQRWFQQAVLRPAQRKLLWVEHEGAFIASTIVPQY